MAKGKKTGGRKAGTPNKLTRDGKEFCVELVDDVNYQAALRQRAMDGKLAPGMETAIWAYAKGKPVETTQLSVDIPEPLRIELTDAVASHAEPSLSES